MMVSRNRFPYPFLSVPRYLLIALLDFFSSGNYGNNYSDMVLSSAGLSMDGGDLLREDPWESKAEKKRREKAEKQAEQQRKKDEKKRKE